MTSLQTGTDHGMYGLADVTGTIKSNDVVLSVTVHGSTARFSGEVSSATKMSGTVTFVLDSSSLPPAGDGGEAMWSWSPCSCDLLIVRPESYRKDYIL